ncbi:hypothetical protein Tco_1438325 [Tanacetum coccineum]
MDRNTASEVYLPYKTPRCCDDSPFLDQPRNILRLDRFPGKFHGYKLETEEEVKEKEGLMEVWEKMEFVISDSDSDLESIAMTANVNNANGGNGNSGNNGCSYKTFTACNPKVFDGKGGAVALTR